jgi:GH15 family glucan-1,4-alpha-glucosidase
VSAPASPELAVRSTRTEGYAPLRDYAAIGDGRTVALVARDGAIDWLCLPNLDSPSVFGALLDAERGGRFALAPEAPYSVERRYLPDTNLLETTFRTGAGAVRVTDALTLTDGGLAPGRELARRIEGLAGSVALSWSLEPRFGYANRTTRFGRRAGAAIASAGADALAVCAWAAGDPAIAGGRIGARFARRAGERALIALAAAHQEPLVLPARREIEARLDATGAFWRHWTGERSYSGPWRDAVLRSALALKLLVYAPSGAIAAAPTTSLPEAIGGGRNWDYRFCWIRDSAFTLGALLALGCGGEAEAFFWWLLQASQLTHPRLQVLYRLDGGARAPEHELPLAGYRQSRPVRVGNGAAAQLQLDTYGDLLETAWLAHSRGARLDPDAGRRLADMADLVCRIWRQPDAGIWEARSAPRHFTHSKVMCWVALDRACRLARAGGIPGRTAARWRAEAAAIRGFVERRCWSEARRSYVRAAGSEELDAALLLASLMGYSDPRNQRLGATIDAVQRELGRGPLLHRYSGGDGLAGGEGAFLTCSFWLVDALARAGRTDEAGRAMEELLALANDVGLYAEEIEPESGAFLGNFPQGLVHLALVNAAVSCAEAGL